MERERERETKRERPTNLEAAQLLERAPVKKQKHRGRKEQYREGNVINEE